MSVLPLVILCLEAGSAPQPVAPPAGVAAAKPAQPAPVPAAPGYGYPPPGYAYPPPGYAYPPPGYAYPPPGYPYPPPPGYPYPPPPGYYGQPYATQPPPPPPVPTGKWRVSFNLSLVPLGAVDYEVNYRGEPLIARYSDINPTLGLGASVTHDFHRRFFAGASLKYLPSFKLSSPLRISDPDTGATATLFNGTMSELDLLAQLGFFFNQPARFRYFAFVAPGYSFVFASGLANRLADPGTAHGFLIQGGGGVLFAIQTSLFLEARLFYQVGLQNGTATNADTGQQATTVVHTRMGGATGAFGWWF